MKAKNLLVIIPHSSIGRPKEIHKNWLSPHQKQFLYTKTAETDRGTEKLYNFRKILKNKQLIFPISQVYINICRASRDLDKSVPVSIGNLSVYKKVPSIKLRRKILKKDYFPFYKRISKTKKTFILNGHSTISRHHSLGNKKLMDDIILSDYMLKPSTNKKIRLAPEGYIDFYAKELKKRLPKLKIGKNSIYTNVYDPICATFGWNGKSKKSKRVPLIHQETDESLYIENNKINYKKLVKLRKAFAESILATMKHFRLA